MLEIEILAIFLSVAAVSLGFAIFKQNEISNLFGGMGAIVLMLTGLMLVVDGVSYSSGYNTTESINLTYKEINFTHYDAPSNYGEKESYWFNNNTVKTTNVTNKYTEVKNDYTNALGLFFMLTGVVLLAAIANNFYNNRAREYEVESD